MKKRLLTLSALLLVFSLLLGGCSLSDAFSYLLYGYYPNTPFSQMEYQRPDVEALKTSAKECAELSKTETNINRLVDKISEFSTLFSNFTTQYMLAYVHYCQDMSDSYWEREYNYCEEHTSGAEAARDQLMHALADCPLRDKLEAEEYFGEGWFEDYEGDSMWTDEFQALMEKESELEAKYYELSAESMERGGYDELFFIRYGKKMEKVFVDLVTVRQQIAREAGYSSYPEFAYDYYYDRDYTDHEAVAYCNEIRQELVPLYRDMLESGIFEEGLTGSTQRQTYDYVREMSQNMGGTVAEAFEHMEEGELYDISAGDNKYSGSFEVYFYDYQQPFVFLGPTGTIQDQLSFTHEFGHFCSDYVSEGNTPNIDIAEVFSQGLEYLSMHYADGDEELRQLLMYSSLSTYVEQAAYACFEQQVYGLSPEDLTVENIRKLFERTGNAFGFDSWGFDNRIYVAISHFFIQPLYVISYVVSNDAAMQLYQLEQERKGAGLEVYTNALSTEEEGFLSFVESVDLESPFAEGRIEEVRDTFKEVLQ